MSDHVETLAQRLAALERRHAAQQAETTALRREVDALRRRLARRRRAALARTLAAVVAVALLATPLAALAANFTDLNNGSPHNASINAIADAGISKGCNPAGTLYCPNDLVTREQMASFLARTAGLGGNPPVANAQTAVTAQNATTATNAVTAGVATNATQLGGVPASGYLRPIGTTVYNIAPTGFLRNNGVTTVVGDFGEARIVASIAASHEVDLALPVPSQLFGVQFRLASVNVCYATSDPATFITLSSLFQVKVSTPALIVSDPTNRGAIVPTCYTLTNPSAAAINGDPILRLSIDFADAAHAVTISQILVTLDPVP